MNEKPQAHTRHPANTLPAGISGHGGGQIALPVCNSHMLFAGGRELVILHHGESYRLRQTRQGKLILTK